MSLLFSQSCPTCGRRVEIRTSLLGRIVACQHCRAEFVANPEAEFTVHRDGMDELMLRVERALQQTKANQGLNASHAIGPTHALG